MSTLRLRYSAEEVACRGDEIYKRSIRSRVEPDHQGEIVAIDIETGAFAIGKTCVVASSLLRAEHPDGEVWLVRGCQSALHRIASHLHRQRNVAGTVGTLSIDYRR